MKLDRFEKGLNNELYNALFDETLRVVEVTFFSPSNAPSDEIFLLEIANKLLDKLSKLKGTLQFEFLGATRKIEESFPQMAFSSKSDHNVLIMHGVISGHFIDVPHSGYNIRYNLKLG